MPLPWKKARISRISRLMVDLQPTKPCNSMVVQTGFPTSLVDLFVKNCDRLKKPMKKKKHHRHHNNHHHQPRAVEEVPVSDPVGDFPADDPVNLNNNQLKRKDNLDGHEYKSVDRFEIYHESDEGSNGGGFDTGCNKEERGVLYAVFMVFLAVILALISIKILTLGITMSACLLIFVEYIGKHILCFFQPCSSARIAFQSPFDLLVSNLVRLKATFWVCLCKEDKREVITEGKGDKREDEEEDSIELNSPAQEIQVAEARFDVVAPAEPEPDKEMILISGRLGNSDMDVEENECEKEHHRRRKSSREIIKKFVPKKWRAMKKARKGKETEEYAGSDVSSHSHYGEDKSVRNEEIEVLYNSESKGRLTECREENEISELQTKSDTPVLEPVIKKERKRGSSLLVMVALVGLLGGRILALGLTVVSCVIIQLVWRGRKQCVKKKKTLSSV